MKLALNIGGVLRAERERRKLTQTEVAVLVGTSRQAIAALESNGGRVATLSALEAVMRVHITGLRRGGSMIEEIVTSRQWKGWSLRDVARRSGLAVNTVRALETGRGSITALISLLNVLTPDGRASTNAPKRGLVTVAQTRNPDRDPLDHYATPPALVRLLLNHEELTRDHPILEPAVGKGRVIDRVLRERGYSTICSDIDGDGKERRCFFDIHEAHHTICTNPPFCLHLEFILHAKCVATHKIAMLMPLNYLTGAERHSRLWSDTKFPLARVHVLNRGVDFQRSDPLSDRFKASQMYMAWFIFQKDHAGSPHLNWIDSHAWVSRASDAKPSATVAIHAVASV